MDELKKRLKKIPLMRYLLTKCKGIVKWTKQIKAVKAIYRIRKHQLKEATYSDLFTLLNKDIYKHYLVKSHETALKKIHAKLGKEPIKIAFQASFLSTWIGNEVLSGFLEDERFDVTAVIAWQVNSAKDREIPQLVEHFSKANIKYKVADGSVHPGDFDIVVYTSPYLSSLDKFGANVIPLSTLVCHVPYGLYIAAIQDMQFNLYIHNINWRNYATSSFYIPLVEKYCGIGSYGMVYSGYPKLDKAYTEDLGDHAQWKFGGSPEQAKKIIFAPHHSIDAEPYYSTFDKNMTYALEYAKSHPTTTSWLFKPHPLLRLSAVKCGLFKTDADYDKYLDEWRSLPNAIVEEGEYLHYMASSDAMILDSVSFMAEYLYFHKPILFLEREGVKMNEFGKEIINVLYHCPGDDFSAISDFIEKTIDHDSMRHTRDLFFEKNLNYYKSNGYLASEFIYRDIVDSISNA